MNKTLATFPNLKSASTELNRVFTESDLPLEGKIVLGKHREGKGGKVTHFDILNAGLNKEEERMVRKILKNSSKFA
jgi:hypothetical protein